MGPVKEGATFNFYHCNLERKFGPHWFEPWSEFDAVAIASWGFNTIATGRTRGSTATAACPNVATVHMAATTGGSAAVSDYWGRMHDPTTRNSPRTRPGHRANPEKVKMIRGASATRGQRAELGGSATGRTNRPGSRGPGRILWLAPKKMFLTH